MENKRFWGTRSKDGPRHWCGTIWHKTCSIYALQSFLEQNNIKGIIKYAIAGAWHLSCRKRGPTELQTDLHSHIYGILRQASRRGFSREDILYCMATALGTERGKHSRMPSKRTQYILKQGDLILKIGKPPAPSRCAEEKKKMLEKILDLVRTGRRLSEIVGEYPGAYNIAAKLMQYSPPRTYRTDVLYIHGPSGTGKTTSIHLTLDWLQTQGYCQSVERAKLHLYISL